MAGKEKAQASLEYLLTYGWALVLIATVVAALVFIVSSPASSVVFSSSDPTKVLMKAGVVSGANAEIKLQNITGGKIEITGITPTGYSGCKIDGKDPLFEVAAGSQMTLECTAPADSKGAITIEYTDFAGLQRSTTITASGSASSGAASLCGNGSLDSGELCDGTLGLSDTENMECNSTCNKIRITGCTIIEEPGSYFFDSALGQPFVIGEACIAIFSEEEESLGTITLEGTGPSAYIDLGDADGIIGVAYVSFVGGSVESLTIQNARVEGTSESQVGIVIMEFGGEPINLLNNDTTGVSCGILLYATAINGSGNQCGTCYYDTPETQAICEQICADPFEMCPG